ncbi:MAG: hypothetical protein WC551_08560 [Patescibacteria group bacterium]
MPTVLPTPHKPRPKPRPLSSTMIAALLRLVDGEGYVARRTAKALCRRRLTRYPGHGLDWWELTQKGREWVERYKATGGVA